MRTPPLRRGAHRGATILETLLVVAVVGAVAVVALAVAWPRIFDRADDRLAAEAATYAHATQQQHHQTYGVFDDGPADPADHVTVVAGAADPRPDDVQLSVAVDGSGDVVGIATRSPTGACYLVRGVPAADGDAATTVGDVDDTCSGSHALTLDPEADEGWRW